MAGLQGSMHGDTPRSLGLGCERGSERVRRKAESRGLRWRASMPLVPRHGLASAPRQHSPYASTSTPPSSGGLNSPTLVSTAGGRLGPGGLAARGNRMPSRLGPAALSADTIGRGRCGSVGERCDSAKFARRQNIAAGLCFGDGGGGARWGRGAKCFEAGPVWSRWLAARSAGLHSRRDPDQWLPVCSMHYFIMTSLAAARAARSLGGLGKLGAQRAYTPAPPIFGAYDVLDPSSAISVYPDPLDVPDSIARPSYVPNNFFSAPIWEHESVEVDIEAPGERIQLGSRAEARVRKVASLAAEVLSEVGKLVRPGVTTAQLDAAAHRLILERKAYPSPLGYQHYPKSITTSVNNVIARELNYTVRRADTRRYSRRQATPTRRHHQRRPHALPRRVPRRHERDVPSAGSRRQGARARPADGGGARARHCRV